MAFAPQAENMAPDVVREAWPHDGPYLQVKGGLGNSERRLCWLGRFLLFGFLKRNGLEGGYIALSPNTSQCFVASACTAMTLSSSAALESVSAAVALPSAVRRSCGLSYSERQSKGTRPIVASPLRLASRLKAASKGPPFCRLSRSQFL